MSKPERFGTGTDNFYLWQQQMILGKEWPFVTTEMLPLY
jgi:hypothetical protein